METPRFAGTIENGVTTLYSVIIFELSSKINASG